MSPATLPKPDFNIHRDIPRDRCTPWNRDRLAGCTVDNSLQNIEIGAVSADARRAGSLPEEVLQTYDLDRRATGTPDDLVDRIGRDPTAPGQPFNPAADPSVTGGAPAGAETGGISVIVTPPQQ